MIVVRAERPTYRRFEYGEAGRFLAEYGFIKIRIGKFFKRPLKSMKKMVKRFIKNPLKAIRKYPILGAPIAYIAWKKGLVGKAAKAIKAGAGKVKAKIIKAKTAIGGIKAGKAVKTAVAAKTAAVVSNMASYVKEVMAQAGKLTLQQYMMRIFGAVPVTGTETVQSISDQEILRMIEQRRRQIEEYRRALEEAQRRELEVAQAKIFGIPKKYFPFVAGAAVFLVLVLMR